MHWLFININVESLATFLNIKIEIVDFDLFTIWILSHFEIQVGLISVFRDLRGNRYWILGIYLIKSTNMRYWILVKCLIKITNIRCWTRSNSRGQPNQLINLINQTKDGALGGGQKRWHQGSKGIAQVVKRGGATLLTTLQLYTLQLYNLTTIQL